MPHIAVKATNIIETSYVKADSKNREKNVKK